TIERLQTRLGWAGYEWLWVTGVMDGGTKLALEMLQGKYLLPVTGKADAKTVKKLVSVAGDGKLDARCLGDGITLCVSKDQRVTRYVRDGKVVKTLNTNFGPEKGHPKFGMYSATRVGVFHTFDRRESAVSTLYGYVMPFWMGFDGGIGFHYSAYFDDTGYIDTSMGCTTIDDYAGMKWLYDNSPLGTKVVVY
ncbi:MAG: murein L,D-transpeptidase, partial [Actinobacteria bacterium]|nr:murein L,D-transpeptidase [Actinomycetota bacterium]